MLTINQFRKYSFHQELKGALNPNFLNLTIENNFVSRNILVLFLDLLLLKSYKRTSPFYIHSEVLLGSEVIAQF